MRVCSIDGRVGGVDVDVGTVDVVGFILADEASSGGSRDGEATVDAGVPEECKAGPKSGIIHAPREYIASHGRETIDVDDGRERRGGALIECNKLRYMG